MNETTQIFKTLDLSYDESLDDISEQLFIQLEDTLTPESKDNLVVEKSDLLIRSILEYKR